MRHLPFIINMNVQATVNDIFSEDTDPRGSLGSITIQVQQPGVSKVTSIWGTPTRKFGVAKGGGHIRRFT
jgi:hypothetical protein